MQSYTFAQYIPFPTNNTVWVNHGYSNDGWFPPFFTVEYLSSIENYCVNNEDTVINTITYTKLNFCDGEYRGAFRDNGGQVFFVSKDSLNEMLLYDFTVNIGDTLTNLYLNYTWFDTLYVSTISSLNIGGQTHKTIFLENEYHNELSDYWIEGVGCSAGLLIEPYTNENVSGWYNTLHCFSRNDSIFDPQSNFYYNGSGSCKLNYMSVEYQTIQSFKLYPNPTQETINIQLPFSTESSIIEIYNSLGELILEQKTELNQIEISIPVSQLNRGLYFVALKNSSGFYSTNFIKN